MNRLPVSECLGEIAEAVAQSIPVVLKSPPGAGKTTGVPPDLIQRGAVGDGQILLVQPRRMAARAAARRIAQQMNVRLGDQVGYHVRFEKRASGATQLVAMTTGVLLRRLGNDPLLSGVDCVILDEFHERSLEVDLALGMLHRIRTTFRPELKLIVMSATLDPDPIVQFLGEARGVQSEGRSFPVDIQYVPALSRDPVDVQIASVLPQVLASTPGHVLVFLPGVGEIHRTHRAIETMDVTDGIELIDLYGDMPPEQQDAVLSDSQRRRIILSTNVAETSITIPGVTAVIDSGQARVMRFDTHVGLPKLQLENISRASAEQRAGRAGRTQPGHCFRLWPQAMHHSRRELDTPEILRGDLSGAVLMLAAWGEREVLDFPWLTPPPLDAVDVATRLLVQLGAVDPLLSITDLGRRMCQLPLHPRLSRFMVEAIRAGVESDASLAAAMLTERDPFRNAASSIRSSAATVSGGCDVSDRIDRLKAFFQGNVSMVGNQSAAHHIGRVAKQILRTTFGQVDANRVEHRDLATASDERLRKALLAAFPDRVARRREAGSDRGVMIGGRGVRLDRRSRGVDSELFLCIDVDSKTPEANVRIATAIQREWLDPSRIREVDEPLPDAAAMAVVARRRTYLGDLLLEQWPIRCEPSAQVREMLADLARQHFESVFPGDDQPLVDFVCRVQFLRQHMPELELPSLDDDTIDQVLVQLCQTRTQIKELRSAPWLDYFRGLYRFDQLQLIEKHSPQRIVVPSGNSVAVHYSAGKPPAIHVRIQELYGWSETPRVASGRVAVQLHLLGPNHRPQQITEDLGNFWNTTYHQVRKDLRGRYPKHHWPEDPTIAIATRNGLKPRP